jgi:hypothetical protein
MIFACLKKASETDRRKDSSEAMEGNGARIGDTFRCGRRKREKEGGETVQNVIYTYICTYKYVHEGNEYGKDYFKSFIDITRRSYLCRIEYPVQPPFLNVCNQVQSDVIR